jgi:drug/metabolite transporter (DMT)-like permease
MTKAYSLAKGGIVATLSYATIVFSIIFGMFLGDSFPSFMVIMGIIFVILSGILVTFKPKQKEEKR